MNSETVLSSIITATSILIAVGFPLLILITSTHKTRKENLLKEIRAYYPVLNSFRYLISKISTSGIVNNYDRQLQKLKTKEEKDETVSNVAYSFFKAINFISKKYENDIMSESIHKKIFGLNEVSHYRLHSNTIWYGIHCRTDVRKELNIQRLKELLNHYNEEIKEALFDINPKFQNRDISIVLIATVAGYVETEVLVPLVDLTKKYEEPLPSLVKNLFIIQSLTLVIGVIIPLLLLQFPNMQYCWLLIILCSLTIFCYILTVLFMGKYIWTKNVTF